MSFKKLIEAIGDSNPEALALAQELETTQSTLTERVTFLEKENHKAYSKRDNALEELGKAKEYLGVTDLNEETLKNLKTGDNVAEVQNLKAQLEDLTNAKTSLETEFSDFKRSTAMDQAITQAGLEAKAANPKTLDIIKGLLQQGATVLEDGTVGYTNPDGTTLYSEGKPVTLEAKMNQIASDEAYAGLFKAQTPGGGGSTANTSADGSKPFKDMSEAERVELYKRNPEEYRRISKQ